jgi:integrase
MMAAMTAAGLSPRTVQYTRAVLRRALGQAMKWSLVRRNVASLVDPPRSAKRTARPLTPDQARAFIEHTKDDRLGPLVHLAIATGMRQGELFGPRWEDMDLAAGTLTVRHALQRIGGKPTLVEPKTALSRRTIKVPSSAVAALKAQRVRQLEERLLAGDRWQDWGLVFASTIGTPLEPSNVCGRFHALLKTAGLPHQRFHDLRHCCATYLLAQRVPPRLVMEVLGHSQISVLMNTYGHVIPGAQDEAAAVVDALLAANG